ncbi:hypothetical protein [Croceivirga thetidis]|uniref:Peptidase M48 domain-containing protein n=1 Tax=Croceivirga thetidis TaxID=2721623 RepID=A0ABX1GM50_9FLAO|nr:hypothetical protein [Croceivirga thetidis]NKI30992.1 hypothetical protein [Croceivirga thetidis]
MKKKFATVLISLFGSIGFVFSQQNYQETTYQTIKFENILQLDELCPRSNTGPGFNSNFDKITEGEARRIIDDFLDELSIGARFNIRECAEKAGNNALANIYVDKNGRRLKYIVYNQEWLTNLASENQSKYAAYFVLAHEIGHLVNGHREEYDGSNKGIEIQADEYAGKTLARYGASLDETLIAVRAIEKLVTPSWASHPGRIARMEAAFEGWFKVVDDNPTRIAKNQAAIDKFHLEIKGLKQQLIDAKRKKIEEAERERLRKEEELKAKIAQEKADKEALIAQQKEQQRLEDMRKAKIAQEKAEEKARLALEEKRKKEQDAVEGILKRYFNALGGLTKINGIEQMTYIENTTRSSEPGFTYRYSYEQKSPFHLIILDKSTDRKSKLHYQILRDTLYYKYPNKSSWKAGMHPNEQMNEVEFRNFIGSSTGDFLEDFNLFASPGLVSIKDTLEFNGVRCYQLEVKEKKVKETLDKNRTGFLSRVQQSRYYRVDNGLLEGTELKNEIKKFKKGKIVYNQLTKTIIKNGEYRDVDGVKFPHNYKIEIVTTRDSKVLEASIVTKKVEGLSFETRTQTQP